MVAAYDVLGVQIAVRAHDPEPIAMIDRSYRSFRVERADASAVVIDVAPSAERAGWWLASGGGKPARVWPTTAIAAVDAMDRLVHSLVSGMHAQNRWPIHAGAAVHRGRAVILSGPSGTGKTTLVLALAQHGLALLSDELAIFDADGLTVHPYRRGLHLRPGTPERIGRFASILEQPRENLGGGIAWAVAHDQLPAQFGVTLADAAPLGAIVLLGEHGLAEPVIEPMRPGVAAMELLRGTWAASIDFAGALRRISALTAAVPCIRMRAAEPDVTAARLLEWLDELHDRGS